MADNGIVTHRPTVVFIEEGFHSMAKYHGIGIRMSRNTNNWLLLIGCRSLGMLENRITIWTWYTVSHRNEYTFEECNHSRLEQNLGFKKTTTKTKSAMFK